MTVSALWQEFGHHLTVTFRHRRMLLLGAIILCVVPGLFVVQLPVLARLVFLYAVLTLAVLPVLSLLGNVKAMGWLIVSVATRRQYRTERWSSEEIDQTAHELGLKEAPRVILTENPHVFSPFTVTFTRSVYVPTDVVEKFPSSKELMPILGHEFTHIKARWRNRGEVAGALGLVLVLSSLLALNTVMLVAEIFEVLFALYLMSVVSWRNEYRADRRSAERLGPEGLISVFEQFKAESRTDEGSYTHPPLGDRIKRLMRLLG